jgi:hypothetical protein
MKPTEKSQPIEDLLNSISPLPRKSSIQRNVCSWCKRPVLGFRDSLSRKEYSISGMCQNCQDDTFGGEE